MATESDLFCDTCKRGVSREEANVCGTIGDLDPDRWQTLCCPHCGARLKTVFVDSDH